MSSLRASSLLGDDEWGTVRLQVVLPDDNTTSTNSDEISRLTKERHYLLEKLQRMGRTLERRAEGIKGNTTIITTTTTTITTTTTTTTTTTITTATTTDTIIITNTSISSFQKWYQKEWVVDIKEQGATGRGERE